MKIRKQRQLGYKNPKWKGGGINKSGYKYFYFDGKRIFEHRYYMEEILERNLTEEEIVHHINGNKLDNRFENLKLMNRKKHIKFHNKIYKNGKFKKCLNCGKTTYFSLSRLNDIYNKGTGRFCGFKCRGLYNNLSQERNSLGQFV